MDASTSSEELQETMVPFSPLAEDDVTVTSGYDEITFRLPEASLPIRGYIVQLRDGVDVLFTSGIISNRTEDGDTDTHDARVNYEVGLDDVPAASPGRLYDMEIYTVPQDIDSYEQDPASTIENSDAATERERAALYVAPLPHQYRAEDAYGFYPAVAVDPDYQPASVTVISGADTYGVEWAEPRGLGALADFINAPDIGFNIVNYTVTICDGPIPAEVVSTSPCIMRSPADLNSLSVEVRVGDTGQGSFEIEDGVLYNASVQAIWTGDAFNSARRFSMQTLSPMDGFIYPQPEVSGIMVVSGRDIAVLWDEPVLPDELGSRYQIKSYDVQLCVGGDEDDCVQPFRRVLPSEARNLRFSSNEEIDAAAAPALYRAVIRANYEIPGHHPNAVPADTSAPAISLDTALFYPTQLHPIGFGDPLLNDDGDRFTLNLIGPALHPGYGSEFQIEGFAGQFCEGADGCARVIEDIPSGATLNNNLGLNLSIGRVERGTDYFIEVLTLYPTKTVHASATGRVERINAVSGIRTDFFSAPNGTPLSVSVSWALSQGSALENTQNYTIELINATDVVARTETKTNGTNSVALTAVHLLPNQQFLVGHLYDIRITSNSKLAGVIPQEVSQPAGGFIFPDFDHLPPHALAKAAAPNDYTLNISWEKPNWRGGLNELVLSETNYNFTGYNLTLCASTVSDAGCAASSFFYSLLIRSAPRVEEETIGLVVPDQIEFGSDYKICVRSRYNADLHSSPLCATESIAPPSLPRVNMNITQHPDERLEVRWNLVEPDDPDGIRTVRADVAIELWANSTGGAEKWDGPESHSISPERLSSFTDLTRQVPYYVSVTVNGSVNGVSLAPVSYFGYNSDGSHFGFDTSVFDAVSGQNVEWTASDNEFVTRWSINLMSSPTERRFVRLTRFGIAGFEARLCLGLTSQCVPVPVMGDYDEFGGSELSASIRPTADNGLLYGEPYSLEIDTLYNSSEPEPTQELVARYFHFDERTLDFPLLPSLDMFEVQAFGSVIDIIAPPLGELLSPFSFLEAECSLHREDGTRIIQSLNNWQADFSTACLFSIEHRLIERGVPYYVFLSAQGVAITGQRIPFMDSHRLILHNDGTNMLGYDPEPAALTPVISSVDNSSGEDLVVTWQPVSESIYGFIEKTQHTNISYTSYACPSPIVDIGTLTTSDCISQQVAPMGGSALSARFAPTDMPLLFDTPYYFAVVAEYSSISGRERDRIVTGDIFNASKQISSPPPTGGMTRSARKAPRRSLADKRVSAPIPTYQPIRTVEELFAIGNYFTDLTRCGDGAELCAAGYRLMNNITLPQGRVWQAVLWNGTAGLPNGMRRLVFDGGGHTLRIPEIAAADEASSRAGFFSILTDAVVTDLHLEIGTITGSGSMGGLAGEAYNATVVGVSARVGSLKADIPVLSAAAAPAAIGGLVGILGREGSETTLLASAATVANLSGAEASGGLVGRAVGGSGTLISSSYARVGAYVATRRLEEEEAAETEDSLRLTGALVGSVTASERRNATYIYNSYGFMESILLPSSSSAFRFGSVAAYPPGAGAAMDERILNSYGHLPSLPAQSGATVVDSFGSARIKTGSELKAGTEADIYSGWNPASLTLLPTGAPLGLCSDLPFGSFAVVPIWNFGTAQDFPALNCVPLPLAQQRR